MNIVPVPREEPDDLHVEMRHEWLKMGRGMGRDTLQIDTVGREGPTWQDGLFELHLTATRGRSTFREVIDGKVLGILWARLATGETQAPPRRQLVGIKVHPTSCSCGGDEAYVALTTLDGLPAGEIMLGCVCHMTVERLIEVLTAQVFERD